MAQSLLRVGAVLAFAAAALPALAQMSPPAAGVTEAQFQARTTADLAALCGAGPQDPNRLAAVSVCHGFLIGAGQYHSAITRPGGRVAPVYCAPTPPPTLDQVTTGFVAWARANPQHANESAVDGLARFAAATYPCPRPARGAR
jgi:hypothetical protein